MAEETSIYIVIKRFDNDEIVKRLDITGKSEREIDKIENGMNRNLNHEHYFTSRIEIKNEISNQKQ